MLRILFAGSSSFSVALLDALLLAQYDVCAVFTRPDKPAGRGRRLSATPIKIFAKNVGIEVQQPDTLSTPEVLADVRASQPDIAVVVAYAALLPEQWLTIPRLGCINIHPSLLPRWRGAAPIQRAIEAGDTVTGVSIFRMEKGFDTGPCLAQASLPISDTMTAGVLADRLEQLSIITLLRCLLQLEGAPMPGEPQAAAGVTYAKKLSNTEGQLNWYQSAAILDRKIRAWHPKPGCFSYLNDIRIKILQAVPVSVPFERTESIPGTVLGCDVTGLLVSCGEGALLLQHIQLPGKTICDLRLHWGEYKKYFPIGHQFTV